MQIIGITGRKRHGKDTVARELVLKGYTVARFADPLKNMLRAFYGTHGMAPADVERRIEGDLKETRCALLAGQTPRHAMQTLGTEWGRGMIGSNLWVDFLKSRLANATKVVVPDVRFENECLAIRAVGGVVWRVDASGRVADTDGSSHVSEIEIAHLPVDMELSNNGTHFELSCAVNAALN